MSQPVEIAQLDSTLAGYGFAYLVTVGESGAHVLAVMPELRDGVLHVGGIGRHSTANADARPAVTLVWPPPDDGGYSLIVDGTAIVGDASLAVQPRKAILHRPAPGTDGRRVGSDCQPVDVD
ncbi:hypothetical protein BH24ACT5_BH24ACT5_07570 [soil metagenome]